VTARSPWMPRQSMPAAFREGEGYDHHFLTLHHAAPTARGQWETVLSGARLDQDTAGFILGERAYADRDLRQ
jgi:iron complex outermembrane recepter protein